MKKLIFASAALIAAATVSAQEAVEAQPQAQVEEAPVSTPKNYKSGDERFGAEAGFTFGNGVSLLGGELSFNYTLTDELTLRLGFGLAVDKTCQDSKNVEGHNTKSTFEINPGLTYSFDGTNRLEPYVGGELAFGFNSRCDYGKYKDDGKTYEEETKTRNSFFGLNALTGFNFYVAEDLYVGAEVGLGFIVYPNAGDVDSEVAKEDTNVDGHRTTIGVNVNPSIRIGWKF